MKRNIIAVIGLAATIGLTGCTHVTGSGEKVGSVIKVANEGLFIKTNEIEIVRGGMNGGSGAFSTTPLKCTVNDEELLEKVKDALNKQYEVKIWYRDYFSTPLSSDSDDRYCVSLEKQAQPTVPGGIGKVTITNPEITVTGDGTITIKSKPSQQ